MFQKTTELIPLQVTVSLGIGIVIAIGLFFYGWSLERAGSAPGATDAVYACLKALVTGIVASLSFSIMKRS